MNVSRSRDDKSFKLETRQKRLSQQSSTNAFGIKVLESRQKWLLTKALGTSTIENKRDRNARGQTSILKLENESDNDMVHLWGNKER